MNNKPVKIARFTTAEESRIWDARRAYEFKQSAPHSAPAWREIASVLYQALSIVDRNIREDTES